MEQIFGFIEKITFQEEESGFTVARLKEPRKNQLTTIVGKLPHLQPGENVRCLGIWKNNSTHGLQFEVQKCTIEAPSDVVGIQKYLSSGLIKGIGPVYAEKIVKKFGTKTLDVIDSSPYALLEVSGLGEKRVEKIKTCWQEQKSIRNVMIFLQSHDISPGYAQKIYRAYGQQCLDFIKENPYQIASDIHGVGFKKADEMAEKMGFLKENEKRIASGILYLLMEHSKEGHTCIPKNELLELCEKTLEVKVELIQERLEQLKQEEKIFELAIEDKPFIWIKMLYLCEVGIAREIQRLLEGRSYLRTIDSEKAIEWVQKQLKLDLADNQKIAVTKSVTDKVHIITGGPGTGKSTITKAILAITEKLTSKILLAAPTGRAAKRLAEITKKEASTIHSLLQFDFSLKGFKHNKENPLECDLIIIDESSMIDTYLMYSLLKAIPSNARVIFVGDIHQLPSVGPGNVLKEIIESQKVTTTILTEIYRQAAGSKIITNAHKINEGIFPDLSFEKNSDFFFVKAETPEQVVSHILQLISKRIPHFYGFHSIDEIQVLSPMKKGIVGIDNLNRMLQTTLNPQEHSITHWGVRYCINDKVMQIRNNYQKEVFNGDIGKIIEIDEENQELLIEFDKKLLPYSLHELEEIVLAYACSIHKYQGSEAPCVIIPVHPSHYIMLHRNLLYTGVTRGKKLVVLVGTGKAIAMAVANNQVLKRHTGLKFAICNSSVKELCSF